MYSKKIVNYKVLDTIYRVSYNECIDKLNEGGHMLEINGTFNHAKIFNENVSEKVKQQVKKLCDQPFVIGSKIRIMPDAHYGAGCTIGTTMTIKNTVVPNLVGVDIGCGVLTINLGKRNINLKIIDDYIHKNIPSGFKINNRSHFSYQEKIKSLFCFNHLSNSADKFERAIGSLGGGNHFIEIDRDTNNNKYLLIHCGSRNLGYQVARYYQTKAVQIYSSLKNPSERDERIIKGITNTNDYKNLLILLKNKYSNNFKTPKSLCYLSGTSMEQYLHDMQIIQKYAEINRRVIGQRIVSECLSLNYDALSKFETVHNYIDLHNMILRKGAVSAKKNEKLIIPLNMRDGALLCIGKGNPDWNYSAPHGAGRIMSRRKAKSTLSIKAFKQSMNNIYSSSVSKKTLDEAPMAYKPAEEILNLIAPTIKILNHIKPIYNFKAN